MKLGELVYIPRRPGGVGFKVYRSFPGEYGFHKTVYIEGDSLGICLELQDEFCKIIVEGQDVWIEKRKIKML